MSFVMTIPRGQSPKRGDLLQTNCGDRRERTWFILRVKKIPRPTVRLPRFEVWRARWWELEPEFRMKLYRSAERRGGQVSWFPIPKPKRPFEDLRNTSREK